jgi:hypothetical protein
VYSDIFDLANLQTYHYLVRAVDASTGLSDDNAVEAAATPDGPLNGISSFFFDDFEDPASFAQWTVTTGPGPHTCGEWALGSSSSRRPTGSSGSFMVADAECAPLVPRTSTTAESPPVDFTIANVISVTLEADVRYDTWDGDDATIEVWDGSEWIVLWTDPDDAFNQHVSYDVSAYALGNSDFRVKFDYQNANADRFFSTDDVDLVTEVYSECSTAAAGPPSVPGGSLLAGRPAGTADVIDVGWDAASCPAAGYNLLYGDLAAVGSYLLSGSECSIGTAGSFTWSGVPSGDMYFLVVGTDGASKESSWGLDGVLSERNGSAASNECGVTVKDPTNMCR